MLVAMFAFSTLGMRVPLELPMRMRAPTMQAGGGKICIVTDKAPAAIGPYSQATVAGKTAYISGCLGLIPGAEKPTLAEGGIEGQTRQCLENLKATVEACGGEMSNVVKTTVLLAKDMSTYPTVNAIYGEYFPVEPPARAAFAVAALPAGGLIEIDASARSSSACVQRPHSYPPDPCGGHASISCTYAGTAVGKFCDDGSMNGAARTIS